MKITQGTIEEVYNLSLQVPEFENPYPKDIYQERLSKVEHLILLANVNDEIAGFKVGYAKEDYFYSWMGAVLPAYRKMGVAKALAKYQENWAKSHGYTTIQFKTRNYLKGMLIFAIKNDFQIIGVETRSNIMDNRILLRKQLIKE